MGFDEKNQQKAAEPGTLQDVTNNLQAIRTKAGEWTNEKIEMAAKALERGHALVANTQREKLDNFRTEIEKWREVYNNSTLTIDAKNVLQSRVDSAMLSIENIQKKWDSMLQPINKTVENSQIFAGQKIESSGLGAAIDKVGEWAGKVGDFVGAVWEKLRPHLAKMAAIPGLGFIFGEKAEAFIKAAAGMESDDKDVKNTTSPAAETKPDQKVTVTSKNAGEIEVKKNEDALLIKMADNGHVDINGKKWGIFFADPEKKDQVKITKLAAKNDGLVIETDQKDKEKKNMTQEIKTNELATVFEKVKNKQTYPFEINVDNPIPIVNIFAPKANIKLEFKPIA